MDKNNVIHVDMEKLGEEIRQIELQYPEVYNALRVGAITGSKFLFKVKKMYLNTIFTLHDAKKLYAKALEVKEQCKDCTYVECMYSVMYESYDNIMVHLSVEIDFSTDDEKFINFALSKFDAEAIEFLKTTELWKS